MRTALLCLLLLFISSFSFGQGSSEAMGGKTGEVKTAPTRKNPAPASKPASSKDRPTYSPCGVYYKNRAEMIGESNLADEWFSLGESASKHFWYNPRKTTCDAKTGVLKSWIKEEHKNTDANYALVLYDFKCKAKQLRVRTVIDYDKTGQVLETTDPEDDTWHDVAPRTAGEVMLRTVCRQP